MKKYKWILFDLDGTLLDTIEDIRFSLNHALKRFINHDEITYNQVKSFIGNGADVLIKRAMNCLSVDEKEFDNIKKEYLDYYKKHNGEGAKPYPYVEEFLKKLKQNNIKIGIISNKPHRDVVDVVNIFFKDRFDYVLGQKEGLKLKPNTEMYEEIKKKFNVKDVETLYIGDMESDLIFANNCNIDCALVTFGFGNNIEFLNPKYLIRNYKINELEEKL